MQLFRNLLKIISQGSPAFYCFFILSAFLVQIITIGELNDQVFTFDFLTPVLLFLFITQPLPHVLWYGLLGSFLLEGSLSYPRYFFIVSYWILGVVIVLGREYLSWDKILSWLFVYICSQIVMTLMEITTTLLHVGSGPVLFTPYLSIFLWKVFFSALLACVSYSRYQVILRKE